MNTIKTLVIVTTLLAVGYGAHIVLNKPIPNGQFAENSAFPKLPGFGKPSLQMDSEDDELSVTLPPLQSLDGNAAGQASEPSVPGLAGQQAPANRFASQAPPQYSPSKTAAGFPTVGQTPPTVQPSATSLGGQAGNALAQFAAAAKGTNEQLAGTSQAMADSTAEAIAQTADQVAGAVKQVTGEFPSGTQNQMQPIPTTVNPAAPVAETTGATSTRPFGPSGRFEDFWFTAQSKLQNGQLVDALLTMSMFFNDTSLTDQQRDQLVPLLDQLAGTVVYSNALHIEAPYEVQPGETLESVARSYGITPSFIMRTNALTSPMLQPGQKIKVVRGPFRGELSLARRELTLFAGRYYAGRFPVAVGRDLPAQASVLEVTELAGPRPYTDPRTGEQIVAGDAHNPYGNLWIGLRDSGAPEFTNLGIHANGAAVDASDSRGCISLSEQDVDDLQAILTAGSRIQIVP